MVSLSSSDRPQFDFELSTSDSSGGRVNDDDSEVTSSCYGKHGSRNKPKVRDKNKSPLFNKFNKNKSPFNKFDKNNKKSSIFDVSPTMMRSSLMVVGFIVATFYLHMYLQQEYFRRCKSNVIIIVLFKHSHMCSHMLNVLNLIENTYFFGMKKIIDTILLPLYTTFNPLVS